MKSTDTTRPPTDSDLPRPLSGVRVLDLSAYIAGPYGCTLLADQGAEVDQDRVAGKATTCASYPSTLEAESRAFLGVNRSKLGVVLDLKKPEGLARAAAPGARRPMSWCTTSAPSVPPRLGIAYEQLRALNPRLIYCAVTGYGDSGPLKDKAGYDQVLQSMTGICALQGKRGR